MALLGMDKPMLQRKTGNTGMEPAFNRRAGAYAAGTNGTIAEIFQVGNFCPDAGRHGVGNHRPEFFAGG